MGGRDYGRTSSMDFPFAFFCLAVFAVLLPPARPGILSGSAVYRQQVVRLLRTHRRRELFSHSHHSITSMELGPLARRKYATLRPGAVETKLLLYNI
jgi:hypothetical protein